MMILHNEDIMYLTIETIVNHGHNIKSIKIPDELKIITKYRICLIIKMPSKVGILCCNWS